MAKGVIKKITYLNEIPDKVYNLQIEDNHNYFVNGVLTHNCDDPVDPRKAASEIESSKANRWWSQTMFSRLNNQRVGLRVVVMQRLAEYDLTGDLLDKKANYRQVCLPIEKSKNIKPGVLAEKYVNGFLHPERYDRPVLDSIKSELGTYDYEGQYMQNPAPPEGGMLKRPWFKIVKESELPEEVFNLPRSFYSDTAYGKKNSDNSATGVCSNWNGKLVIWLVNAVNLPEPEFRRHYISLLKEQGYTTKSRCVFEPKATGDTIIQNLRELRIEMEGKEYLEETLYYPLEEPLKKAKIREYERIGITLFEDNMERLYFLKPKSYAINVIADQAPVDSKETRVRAISSIIEAGNVLLVEGGWNEDLIQEATMFPNGKYDDRVDALEMMVRNELSNKKFKGFKNNNIVNHH